MTQDHFELTWNKMSLIAYYIERQEESLLPLNTVFHRRHINLCVMLN